jgi:hypothetical protein
MSTHSNIGVRESDGTIRVVYCHSDGYPSYNGRILLAHYTDESAVRALIGLGDLSFLAPTLDKTIAYHRDRGEPKAEAHAHPPGRFKRENDYAYVFDVREARWYWSEDAELKPLTPDDVANE